MANTDVTKLNFHMITALYLGICVLSMILILFKLIYKLKQSDHVSLSKASKFYKIVTIVSIVSFLVSSSIDFGVLVYYFLTGIDVVHTDYVWLIAAKNIFYGIAAVTLYMIVFGKLYFTLKKAAKIYQLHKCVVYYMIIMITCIGLLLQFYGISFFFLYTNKVFFYHMLDIIFLIVAISDFILTVSMVIMFIYQLSRIILGYSNTDQLVQSTNHNNNDDNDNDNDNDNDTANNKHSYYQAGYDKDDDNSESDDTANNNEQDVGYNNYLMINLGLNQNQLILLDVITRHSILCTFAIVGNQLFYASVLYASSIKERGKQDLVFLAYSNIVQSTLGVTYAIALYLNFSFSTSLYRKWCNCCHVCCYNRFKTVLKKRMNSIYTAEL